MATIFLGNVDAANRQVACHVLPEVRELQPRTDKIRECGTLGVVATEQVQHEVPDGVRGVSAVLQEFVEGRVIGLRLILPERDEQILERLGRDGFLADRLLQRDHHRVFRRAVVASLQFALPPCEQRQRGVAAARFIGEIVGPTAVRIDRVKVRKQLPG